MTPRIRHAVPSEDLTVAIEWDDGSRSVADMAPIVRQGGVLAPMADPAFFVCTMAIHWRGDYLCWEGDLAFSAEALWTDSRARRNEPSAAAE
ncbi:MAG: DUF2442 domain-containing protein [Alphaproteobacteria bacterium]|nr:DUF2442 domain-containing protein [Alphaproteobacteria bacterium]